MIVTGSLSAAPLEDCLACFIKRKQNCESTIFSCVVTEMSEHIIFPLGGFWYLEFLEEEEKKNFMESTPPPSCVWWKQHQVFVCESVVMSAQM